MITYSTLHLSLSIPLLSTNYDCKIQTDKADIKEEGDKTVDVMS